MKTQETQTQTIPQNTIPEPAATSVDQPVGNPQSAVPPAGSETTPPSGSSSPSPKDACDAAKIARLPKPTRDMINLMLDDGLPYHVIIDELAETGRGLTPESLVKWLQSGYEVYLKNREMIDEAKTQAEFAADLLRELGDVDPAQIYRACHVLTALQIFKAIDDHGDEALRKMLHVRPTSYISLMNSLCELTETSLKLEKHHSGDEIASREGAGVNAAKPPTATL